MRYLYAILLSSMLLVTLSLNAVTMPNAIGLKLATALQNYVKQNADNHWPFLDHLGLGMTIDEYTTLYSTDRSILLMHRVQQARVLSDVKKNMPRRPLKNSFGADISASLNRKYDQTIKSLSDQFLTDGDYGHIFEHINQGFENWYTLYEFRHNRYFSEESFFASAINTSIRNLQHNLGDFAKGKTNKSIEDYVYEEYNNIRMSTGLIAGIEKLMIDRGLGELAENKIDLHHIRPFVDAFGQEGLGIDPSVKIQEGQLPEITIWQIDNQGYLVKKSQNKNLVDADRPAPTVEAVQR